MVAGAAGGAGTLACALFCANGVAAADLSAPPGVLVGAAAPGLPVLSDVLFSAVATGLSPIGLSEVVPLMLKFYRDATLRARPRPHARRIDKLYEGTASSSTGNPIYPEN